MLQEHTNGKFEKVVQQTASLAQQLKSLKQGADSCQVMPCCLTCSCPALPPLGCCPNTCDTNPFWTRAMIATTERSSARQICLLHSLPDVYQKSTFTIYWYLIINGTKVVCLAIASSVMFIQQTLGTGEGSCSNKHLVNCLQQGLPSPLLLDWKVSFLVKHLA